MKFDIVFFICVLLFIIEFCFLFVISASLSRFSSMKEQEQVLKFNGIFDICNT